MNPLIEYIQTEILPRYDSFDKAHGKDHIEYVIAQSLELAKHYQVNADMVYTIAAYHDLGMPAGREFHHKESAKILLEDEVLKDYFSQEQLLTMRDAIEDHRASSKNAPRTIYGMIVAEADRQIDPLVTIRRTIQYGQSHYPELSKEEQFQRMKDHLNEKYAEGGYLKLWIPFSDNASRLQELREIIKDQTKLRQIFEQTFSSLQ